MPEKDKTRGYLLFEMITDILSALNDTEQKQLNKLLSQHDSQPYQIIRHTMEGQADKAWLIKKLHISESSYFKNLTLARDVLFEVIKNETFFVV